MLVSSACRVKPIMKLAEIKHPAFARSGEVEGGYEKTLDRVISEVRDELRDKCGAVDYEILFVDDSGTWAGAEQIYATQFTGAGWQRVTEFPVEKANYQFGAWEKSSWFEKPQVVAVAFVADATPGSDPKQQFLIVFVPRREG